MSTERTVEDEIAAIEERLDELKERVEDDDPEFPWDGGEYSNFAIDEKTWLDGIGAWRIKTSAGCFNNSEIDEIRDHLELIKCGDGHNEIILHVKHPDGDDK